MKKLIAMAMGMTLLGGCAMKEFSSTPFYSGSEVTFTGAVEDRVNLWPLGYWREPVGSIAWPLVSWGNDHFAMRPLYSQYKQGGSGDYDEFNVLWPVGQFDTKHDDYRFFPFFWGDMKKKDPYFCLFPVLWRNKEFAGVLPFFWERDDNEVGFCVFPLFWSKVGPSDHLWNTLFPLYYYQSNEEQFGQKGGRIMASGSKFWALCGLAGYNRCDGEFTDHRFLPLYFADRSGFYSLPYSRHERGDSVKNLILCGLAGCESGTNGNYQASWLLPLYYHSTDEFVTPLFGKDKDSSWLLPLYYNDRDAFLTPLYGKTKDADWLIPFYYREKDFFITPLGGKSGDTEWVLPLFWRDETTFASLPYWRKLGKDGEIDSAFSLPLLSGYDRDSKSGDRLLYMFLGLGGHVWNDTTGGASWVFPLYYSDHESFYTLLYGSDPRRTWLFPLYYDGEERTYITPLYGRDKKEDSEWLFPLYYRDKETFVTPLYGKCGESDWLIPIYTRDEAQINTIPFSYWDDAKKGMRGFFSLPLLSGANWSTNTSEYTWLTLAGLVGGKSDASGKVQSEWAFPAFYREKGKSFSSLPYGWSGGGTSQTNTYFACGLAGTHAGSREGGWLFPIFNHKENADFDEKSTWLDRDSLPDEIKVTTRLATNRLWNATTKKRDIIKTYVETNATYVSSWSEWSHFLFSDNDRHVSGNKKYKQSAYTLTASHKMGNKLFFRREKRRSVDFDLDTRKKTSDTESGWHSLLPLGYYHEWEADVLKGTSKQSHRVLWKLWDWEEENGDVALDVFPGFTYDTKKNGYRKTSFLWRLFRCENDPKKGRKVDLFFIPVWR